MARRKAPVIPDAVLDQLLAGGDAKAAFDQNGLLDQLKKALAERVLKAEMDHHLAGDESGNRRNGYGRKTVLTDTGAVELSVPRDRASTFDPQLIGKYQRRFPGFDDSEEDQKTIRWIVFPMSHLDVRAGYVDTGNHRPSAGTVRDRGIGGPDLSGDGRGAG
ncbi:Transposase, Mutator family [Azospirillum sp. RU38E]|nr:Transposase, Mutator family [Azospirillum sp. RU38E]SNT34022.1 Transposase, Mutator family [Azospirillum sp. RU37A]